MINLVTKDLVRAADYCGVRSGRDVDKFAGDASDGTASSQNRCSPLVLGRAR